MTLRLNPWDDPGFAGTYAEESANPTSGWYEQQVNAPSVIALIPQGAKRLLDFGSGPGDFTAMLSKQFQHVEGCDHSPAMVSIAKQQHSELTFFQWDGQAPLPTQRDPYDLIVSKLVVPFIRDLSSHIRRLRESLQPSGSLVISTVHPVHSAKQVANYWQTAEYQQQIGRFGIYDVVLHRSLETIIAEFSDNGFMLARLSEPKTPEHLARVHQGRPCEFALPKRINLHFRLIGGSNHEFR